MKKLWARISAIGLHSAHNGQEEQSIAFVNKITAVIGLCVLSSVFINLILGSFTFVPVLSGAFLLLFPVYFFNSRGRYLMAAINLFLVVLGMLVYMCLRAGLGAGLEFYFLSLVVLPLIIFRNNRIIYVFQLCCIAGLIIQKFFATPYATHEPLPYKVFYIVNGFYSSLLIILAIRFFRDNSLRHEKKLVSNNQVIEERNMQLQIVNNQLDSFAYSVSHDLRSPLRAIDGFTKVVLRNPENKLDEESRQLLEMVVQNVVHANQLIRNLLDFSRAGKSELHIEETDMQQMVESVLNDLKENIEKAGTKIVLYKLERARADAGTLYQVWTNLISNAIKYSSKKENPQIEISSYKDGNKVIFKVKDNGAGFDMRQANRLFGIFQRLHTQEDFEGTGIGLSIVKTIVGRHGGQVWAEAQPGKGATFYFSLPE